MALWFAHAGNLGGGSMDRFEVAPEALAGFKGQHLAPSRNRRSAKIWRGLLWWWGRHGKVWLRHGKVPILLWLQWLILVVRKTLICRDEFHPPY